VVHLDIACRLDISKHCYHALIAISGKRRRRRLIINNALEDFQHLGTGLASFDLPVRIEFEVIGNYHRILAHYLGRAVFEFKLVSLFGRAWPHEAPCNSQDKNDPRYDLQ